MMRNPFIKPNNEYKRDITYLKEYYEDCARFISIMRQVPFEEAWNWVKKKTKEDPKFKLIDPVVRLLTRDKNLDRFREEMTFTQYIQDTLDKRHILSPSLTSYVPIDQDTSVIAEYVIENMQKRKLLKKAALHAEVTGDHITFNIKEGQQTSQKIKNNALSGASAQPHSAIFNKSTHSTLTSTCRTATSYGNSNNERLIAGNRHYWSVDIIIADMMYYINVVDSDKVKKAMNKYGIRYPTVEEVLEMVWRSSIHYWNSPALRKVIQDLVTKMTDIQRAVVHYSGDLYHLMMCNSDVIRQMFSAFIDTELEPLSLEEADDVLTKQVDEFLWSLALTLNRHLVKGIPFVELKEKCPEAYCKVAATGKHLIQTFNQYVDLFEAFICTNALPTTVYSIPSIMRDSVLGSDTDSNIFTTQEWGKWYTGKYSLDDTSRAIGDVVNLLVSYNVANILATVSANMGVAEKDVKRLRMKNEYSFPVFCLTKKAKHYFAFQDVRESNVMKKPNIEVKGVGLRGSATSDRVAEEVDNVIEYMLSRIAKGKKISAFHLYDRIATIESDMRTSLDSGHIEYLTKGRINDMNAYAKPMSSSYAYHDMWVNVFADTYGEVPDPPYSTVKVNMLLHNKTAIANWLEKMEDKVIANKMRLWLDKTGRDNLESVHVPDPIVSFKPIPKEIVMASDVRGTVYGAVRPLYDILETTNLYFMDENNCRLISDFHKPSIKEAS